MSAPKLYLIRTTENVIDEVRTFRELDDVLASYSGQLDKDSIYILHCGFLRPNVRYPIGFPAELKGKMLYSPALKWALPQSFRHSTKPVATINAEDVIWHCFLAANEWGYEADLGEYDLLGETGCSATDDHGRVKETIVLAAKAVLDDSKGPLNKEEIYALIVENGYYQFNTPKPVHVLDVQLNRYTLGTNYSKPAETSLFGKTNEGKYYLLGSENNSPAGWVGTVSKESPRLYQAVQAYRIFDEESYQLHRDALPEELRVKLDSERFSLLREKIDQTNPHSLLEIAPDWIRGLEVSELGLSVRSKNALIGKGVSTVGELANLSREDLLRFPNMGKLSIADICDSIVRKVVLATTSIVEISGAQKEIVRNPRVQESASLEISEEILANQAAQKPLIAHLSSTLEELKEVDRLILHGRLGFKGKALTLEQIAKTIGVTRERVRQRQKKYVERIITREYWDDVIGIRIGQLLIDRDEPLILEMLDVEDDWFGGFGDNFEYLSNTIQMFSENEIHVIDANGRNVITRTTQNQWDGVVKKLRSELKHKASERRWSRDEIDQYFSTSLSEFGGIELTPIIRELFEEYLQYNGESISALLVAYGASAESAVAAVLAQAESPLHFTEVAKRASEILGKPVENRRAHQAVLSDGVWLYDRGTYGLIDHCPIPESRRLDIRRSVENILYQGPINKQWHSKGIIEELEGDYPGISNKLDPYILRMCIEESEKILFLGRMVWARSDSGMEAGDRIETTESFIHILEEVGRPLSGRELKQRLSEIRDVPLSMQIHGNERMIAVEPNVWGLSEWVKHK